MAKKYQAKSVRRSRYRKEQEKKAAKQTTTIILATIGLIALLIIFGIPALTKIAVFFADIRSSSEPIESTNTIVPTAPRIDRLPEATNSAQITINGRAKAGSAVTLVHNDSPQNQTIASEDGTFSLFSLQLEEGENTFYAYAADNTGNQSSNSLTRRVVYDTISPEIEVHEPKDGQEFYYSAEREIQIAGISEPKSKLEVNEKFILVKPSGEFKTTIRLEEGENAIDLNAVDLAGNKSSKSITVTYHD